MCDVLKEIYRKVYDEAFVYGELDHRIKLQKAVYILENMGVHVGDYSFSWNKYGPYSLGLDSDAQKCNSREEQEVIFSEIAETGFRKIKEYLSEKISYTCVQWMECIASLHYLKNVLRYDEDFLLSELVERKPYLEDESANLKALSIMKDIKVNF
ncbi:MAG: hypothetical protein KHW82_12745 [Lachnospiraceae bacterium]|nr:hypothetical protein [Lachnospiraceae bacterium]